MRLDVCDLSKNYGAKKALVDFSASFSPGIYGLLGPNGAGKSTLMNILAGNLEEDRGYVKFNNMEIKAMGAEYRRILGYMPQQQGLYESFTARRFLSYMAALKGMSGQEAGEQICRLLKAMNLDDSANKRLGAFSGGMKQRILIAQAILGDPDLLILDEPTAGLDPKERIRIRNLISEVSFNKIVIIATHVVSDIEFIASEVILMNNGRLLAKKSPSQLLDDIAGKVFEVRVPEEDLNTVSKSYKVGNIAKDKDGIVVRIVSDKRPEGYACSPAKPLLEDVYLYMFDDRGIVA